MTVSRTSSAAAGCDEAERILPSTTGTDHINVDIWGTQGGASALTTARHFQTVGDVDGQIVDARVWIGFHFRSSVIAGLDVGNQVANWTLKRYFRPVSRSGRHDG